jgi:hypothetical protein
MVAKAANACKRMEVQYIINIVYLLHASVTIAIFRERYYTNGYIEILQKFLNHWTDVKF